MQKREFAIYVGIPYQIENCASVVTRLEGHKSLLNKELTISNIFWGVRISVANKESDLRDLANEETK